MEGTCGFGNRVRSLIYYISIHAKHSRGVIRQCPNWSKVNWAHFQAELMARLHGYSELIEVPDSISAVDDFERCLTSNIQTVIDHQIPMKRICDFSRSWWTPEIRSLRKRQNSLCRHWHKSGCEQDRVAFLKGRRRLRAAIVEAKKSAWQKFCEQHNQGDHWHLYHEVVRSGGSGQVEDLQVGCQRITSDSGKTQAL